MVKKNVENASIEISIPSLKTVGRWVVAPAVLTWRVICIPWVVVKELGGAWNEFRAMLRAQGGAQS